MDNSSLLSLLGRAADDAIAITAPAHEPLPHAVWLQRTPGTLNGLGIGCNDRVAIVLANGPEMGADEFDFLPSDWRPGAGGGTRQHLAWRWKWRSAWACACSTCGDGGAPAPLQRPARWRRGPRRGRPAARRLDDVSMVLHTSAHHLAPEDRAAVAAQPRGPARNIARTLQFVPPTAA